MWNVTNDFNSAKIASLRYFKWPLIVKIAMLHDFTDGTVVGETLAGQTLAVFWIFLEIFKKSIFIYWKNIGKTK